MNDPIHTPENTLTPEMLLGLECNETIDPDFDDFQAFLQDHIQIIHIS